MLTRCTILGIDIGTVNAGFGVVQFQVKKNKVAYKIHKCGLLQCLVKDLSVPHKRELKAHVREVKKLVKTYAVDYVLEERYMTRGIKGSTVEAVNQMMGALDLSLKQEVTQIPAATWKNRVNKFFDLKFLYTQAYVPPHEIDAVLQAFWLAEKKMGCEIIPQLTSWKEQERLLEVIEACTTTKLKTKR